MRHKTSHDTSFLLLFIVLVSFATSLHPSEEENDERHKNDLDLCGAWTENVDVGRIVPPSLFDHFLTCTWVMSAPPGKKLSIDVEHVFLPTFVDRLWIDVDGKSINFRRICGAQIGAKCLLDDEFLVGEVLNVTYKFDLGVTDDVDDDEDDEEDEENEFDLRSNDTLEQNFSQPMSFLISFVSFDPNSCSTPVLRDDVYVVGGGGGGGNVNWTVGANVKFGCAQPYDVEGTTESKCVVEEFDLFPRWKPSIDVNCSLPLCNGLTQEKRASAGRGMIVHPGYPAKMVLSEQRCVWKIRSPSEKKRVRLKIVWFSLPSYKKKKGAAGGKVSSYLDVYDEDVGNLMARLQSQQDERVLTSSTSCVVLELRTGNVSLKGNDATEEFGFTIEYGATCDVVDVVSHGRWIGDVGVGDNVTLHCDTGFEVEGKKTMICKENLEWSEEFLAVCRSTNRTKLSSKTKSVIHQDISAKKLNKDVKKGKDIAENETSFVHSSQEEEEENEEKEDEKNVGKLGFFGADLTVIAVGVSVPILLIAVIVIYLFWYRRRYPVRMGFGKKFETFENPAYERRKKGMSDDPAELQKLTSLPAT